MTAPAPASNRFRRLVLPGLAFKAVVIGGGYATGRELAEFFLPSGPIGGLLAILVATAVWSIVGALTLLLAFLTQSHDYRTFFTHLLGRAWVLFELCYIALLLVVLAVFAAAAGEIVYALFHLPRIVGTLALVGSIALFSMYGSNSVEALFKWVSFLLYATYAAFLILSLSHFGDRIAGELAASEPPRGWIAGGITYAGYNIFGAVIILPVIRHMRRPRDAIVAGLAAGPMAMLPAAIFFLCMIAFYPEIGREALPSNFLLAKIGSRFFQVLFQFMILGALLESGTGCVHAVNERAARTFGTAGELPPVARLVISGTLLVTAVFGATRFGLVSLIASGYRFLAWAFLLVYVLPMVTVGTMQIVRINRSASSTAAAPATSG